ncbi:hypothetical protein [Corynebacterium bovis]|uniref:hypothetical protein n=1 Tax=Corynebacterium bovis TaxID=36808 RepID=UPI0031388263
MSDRSGYSPQRRRPVGGLVVAVVVVVVVLGAAVVFLVTRGGSDKSAGDAGQSTSSTAGGAQASATASGGAGVTSDFWGRRVVLPANPDGDVIPQKPVETTDACNPVNYSRVPDDLTTQRTHTAPTLWSSTDGPTGITGTTPTGYTHTPQGAALAGWNYMSMYSIGGTMGLDSVLNFGGFSEGKKQELRGLDQPTENATRDRTNMVAPAAVEYLSCHDDQVVVKYYLPGPDPETGSSERPKYTLFQIPVIWKSDHWEMDMSGQSGSSGQIVDSIDGKAVKWDY